METNVNYHTRRAAEHRKQASAAAENHANVAHAQLAHLHEQAALSDGHVAEFVR